MSQEDDLRRVRKFKKLKKKEHITKANISNNAFIPPKNISLIENNNNHYYYYYNKYTIYLISLQKHLNNLYSLPSTKKE